MLLSIIYLISLGVLIAYSILVYKYTPEKSLGPLTSVAVFTTDLIGFFMMNAKLAKGPVPMSMLLLGFRICLFAFGGDYWFLGYCVLYFVLAVHLAHLLR